MKYERRYKRNNEMRQEEVEQEGEDGAKKRAEGKHDKQTHQQLLKHLKRY